MIVNLTPHAIVLLSADEAGEVSGNVGYGSAAREGRFRIVATIPSTGVARAATTFGTVGWVEVAGEKFPVTSTIYGEPEGLPCPSEGTILIVSTLTAQAAQAAGRTIEDLRVPGELVRKDGQPIGCTALSVV